MTDSLFKKVPIYIVKASNGFDLREERKRNEQIRDRKISVGFIFILEMN